MSGRFTSETAAEAGRKGGSRPKPKKKPEEVFVRRSYRIPPEILAIIERKAKEENITATEVIIRGIRCLP